MALRILTGTIMPKSGFRTNGTAVVDFRTHDVGGNAEGAKQKDTAPRRNFLTAPGRIVSMREFIAQDRRTNRDDRSAQDRFRIDDKLEGTERLEISWGCESGAEIREISYLVVGEV